MISKIKTLEFETELYQVTPSRISQFQETYFHNKIIIRAKSI